MLRVGVLTYNVISTLRDELQQRTLDSIERAFPDAVWTLFDNGSTDGSNLGLATDGWFFHQESDVVCHSPGAGRNRLMKVMAPDPNDIIVLSDDDMCWRPSAGAALKWFWDDAPNDVILASALLEPEYPWSKPTGVVEIGGLRALVRPSVPAAAWTFRARDWDKIGPLKTSIEGEGEDFEACKRLRGAGYRLLALDLAEHIGDGYSQLGNDEARKLAGRPINKSEWGTP